MAFLFKRTIFTRTIFFALVDSFLIAVSVWLSFLLRFDSQIPPQYFIFIPRMIVLAIIFIIPTFYFLRLYSFSWAYVSASEAIRLFSATSSAFIFLGIAIYISNHFPYFQIFPRSTLFTSYFLVLILCGGIRFSKRIYLHIRGFARLAEKEKILIVGAGDAGEQILRSILSSKSNLYAPVGFLDDNPIKQGVTIHGVRVLGKIFDMQKIVADKGIKQLIIALPAAGSKTIKNAIELGRKSGLKKIKIAPHINEIINGEVSFKNLKDVDAGDLLFREQIILDAAQIENFIKNKIVLITGAAGSIGSELSRQIAGLSPFLLLLLDQDETGIFNISNELEKKFPYLKIHSLIADVTDKERINRIFKEFLPKIIFHAAAYKHVPLMEENPDEAVKNNVFGAKILTEASFNSGVEKFIFISTDKAVNPTSVMGATKRIGEMICQAANKKGATKFISVRFGNVLDSRGSVIPTFREQIKKREAVTITDPGMKRYFMLIPEACLLVMQSGAMGKGGEVFVLDMGRPIKILDLAKEMIKSSGLEPDKDIAIVFTGKRPGEKLFEEILTAEEGTVATKNQKIFMAKLSDINPSDLEKKLDEIKLAVNSKEQAILKELLKSVVLLSGIFL
ncbi:MAG: nucleoside-diphosphate sugar epimerase/dehydratase [bacterium]